MSAQVLVLNRNFHAIEVIDWRRALGLLYLDHAMVDDESWRTYDFHNWLDLSRYDNAHHTGVVHTTTMKIAITEVIALKVYGKVPPREVRIIRQNSYLHFDY